jgi:hypothetical protein
VSPKPMLTDDYLIRQINLAIAALASIIGLKTAGQYQQAQVEIEQLLEQLTGLRAYMLKNLTDEGLLAVVSNANGLDADRLLIIADLINEEGDIYASQGYAADSTADYLRALKFYLEVALTGDLQYSSPPDEKIEVLMDKLAGTELPSETAFNLFTYYEQNRKFAKAERQLIKLQEATGHDPSLLEEHKAFYERLLEKSDQELETGGLPRPLIETNLANLSTFTH